MNSRSQDDLDHLPSISLSPDDMSERQSERGKKRPEKQRRTGSGGGSHTPPDSGTSRFPIGTVILSIAFLALAAGGYLQIKALEKDLTEAREQLGITANQLSEVSGTVSETGETLNRSDSEVRDELKAVNFEIRKLWDLSNRRNRPNIEAQGKRIDALAKTVAASEQTIKGSVTQIGDNASDLEKASKELAVLKKELRAVNADVVAGSAINREQLDNMQKTVDGLVGTVNKAAAGNKKLAAETEKQLKEYAEKIKAVDAHRQQINRRLLQLENSVRGLESGSRPGLTLEPGS